MDTSQIWIWQIVTFIVYIHIPHLDLGCIHREKSESILGHIPQSAESFLYCLYSKQDQAIINRHDKVSTIAFLNEVSLYFLTKIGLSPLFRVFILIKNVLCYILSSCGKCLPQRFEFVDKSNYIIGRIICVSLHVHFVNTGEVSFKIGTFIW